MATYTDQDDGAAVSLHVGEELDVRLAENASTGYRWELVDVDRALLDVTRDESIPPAGPTPGAGGGHAWTFRGRAPGRCSLRFTYRRNWEGAPPDRAFSLDVSVT